MKKKHYIIIAIASYFIFLIATIPAKPFADLINNNTQITMQGVSGTLWDGSAYSISIDNNTVIKNTDWSLTIWKILIGQVTADVSTRYLNNDINSEVGASIFGNYFANDLTASIAAKDIAQLANIPLAELSGSIAINIEHAQWSQGELPKASGVINWDNAAVTVAETVLLGNVNIVLQESEQELLIADINNKGGDITITGTAQLVPEADYATDIKFTPTATANNNVAQSLGLFAKKQNNGSYILKNTGSLKQFGLM